MLARLLPTVFIVFAVFFSSCRKPCPQEELYLNNAVQLTFRDSAGEWLSYDSIPYKQFHIMERNETYSFDILIEEHNEGDQRHALPLDLENKTNTFYLQGDGVADTLVFTYNVTTYFTVIRCGVQAAVVDLKVQHSTLPVKKLIIPEPEDYWPHTFGLTLEL